MANTNTATKAKAKNDTTAVTRSIMRAARNKEEKEAAKAAEKAASVNKEAKEAAKEATPAPAKKASPAPVKAEEKKPEKQEETALSMSTDAFSKETLTEFQKREKAVKTAIGKIDTSFETIAFNLHWIHVKQAYKAEGFPSIETYCADVFGYQKTTCYSLIAVVDRFAKRDEKGAMLEAFDERVKGYSVSKLSLMVNLTDSEIDSLKPTMSVRDIKKIVKGLEGKALPVLSEGDGEPEDDAEGGGNEDDNIIDSTAMVISNTLIKISGKAEYEKKADRFDEYIQRVFSKHPDAVIEISYSLPAQEGKEEKKA